MSTLDLTADIIDLRDVTDRAEELEAEALELLNAADDGNRTNDLSELSADTTAADLIAAGMGADDAAEMILIRDLLEELRGAGGGDHQWRGDWYPASLIRDDYFETAMDELLEDIGDLPRDLPGYLKITVDYDALRMDYSSVDVDGTKYWWR